MHADVRARLHKALADLSAGDRRAFDVVFSLAWPVLRGLAARTLADEAEAEDAAQRALLKLFASASKFDAERDAVPWMVTFLLNEVRTTRARRRRRPHVSLEGDVCSDDGPESELVRADLVRAVTEVTGTLSHDDRIALGLDGQAQDLAPATRRKRKQRALGRLRTAWRKIHGLA
ncbi:MAG: sigma factor [Myxococcota bacterium]